MRKIDPDVLKLARSIGVDVEDPTVAGYLAQDFLNHYEIAAVLERDRTSIYTALRMGNLRAESTPHGKISLWRAHPFWVMTWAAGRPERYRYVSWERAYLYAVQDGTVDELPEEIRDWGEDLFGKAPETGTQ